MEVGEWVQASAPFLQYIDHWQERLAPLPLEQLIREADGPENVAIFCVDVVNGFCHEGQLQSDRVRVIVEPIADLLIRAHGMGVRYFVLPQDTHPADAVEFTDFPVHCIVGTTESATVPELADLPFASEFVVIPKRSLSASIGTSLDGWLAAHPHVTHRIVVGDCTDLCVYQLAMHLKLSANVANTDSPVIVPVNCVDTYDVPLDLARDLGIPAHPGDVFHGLFLFHMRLNGIRVVSDI